MIPQILLSKKAFATLGPHEQRNNHNAAGARILKV
jgi:hypothetical protein